jgi:hypothetical protein
MKTKIMKIAVFILVVAGVTSCAHPNAKEIDSKDYDANELSIDRDSTDLVKTNPEAMMARADSLVDYNTYVSIIDARYDQNGETLSEMKKNFKSEVNAVQMEYDQELYELNKRNLQIKTKVKNHEVQNSESWNDFKTIINNEIIELEKSIRELAEKAS